MTTISTFPTFNRRLHGPGPSDVHARILDAMAKPTIGHLDPKFIQLMDEIQQLTRYAFQTANKYTFPISAPASAGMEACFVNLLEPGDKAIVCINGVFGERMKQNVERCGAEAIVVADEWGKAIDANKVKDALKQHPDAKLIAFVHAETSTGVKSDVKTLCEIAKKHDCLTLVDAVTSLAGCELAVDDWNIDVIYSGTQKCLSCPPGLSLLSFSDRAAELIKQRKHRVQSWFLDFNLLTQYWSSSDNQAAPRAYHHTAPINALFGLHEALVMLHETGLEQSWKNHALHAKALHQGLIALGLNYIVDENNRLPQLHVVSIPDGIDDASFRADLLKNYELEIGAGLGQFKGKVWRIGLMGYSCEKDKVLSLIKNLANALKKDSSVLNDALRKAEECYDG